MLSIFERVLAIFVCIQIVSIPGSSWPRAAAAAAETSCIRVNPPPANISCNLRGSYNPTQHRTTTDAAHVSSIEECAAICARHPIDCGSFEYVPAYSSCTLFYCNSSRVYDPSRKGIKPLRIYNDPGCYDCGNVCADGQPYGTQLLDNSGFENRYLGPWLTERATYLPRGKESGHSLGIDYRNISYNYGYDSFKGYDNAPFAYQSFNTCPGAYYQMSFDYSYSYGFANPDAVQARVGIRGDQSTFIFYPRRLGLNDTWAQGRIFTTEDTLGELVFYASFDREEDMDLAKDNYLAVDNVVVSQRPAPRPKPGFASPTELNGNFESGTGAPWQFGNYNFSNPNKTNGVEAKVSSPGLGDSKYALRLHFPNLQAKTFYNPNVPTMPNTLYIFSFQTSIEYFETVYFDIYILSGGNYVAISRSYSSGKKHTISQPVFIQDSLADIVITTSVETAARNCTVTFDNISLLPISEDF